MKYDLLCNFEEFRIRAEHWRESYKTWNDDGRLGSADDYCKAWTRIYGSSRTYPYVCIYIYSSTFIYFHLFIYLNNSELLTKIQTHVLYCGHSSSLLYLLWWPWAKSIIWRYVFTMFQHVFHVFSDILYILCINMYFQRFFEVRRVV